VIYLDSCIAIYLTELVSPYAAAIQKQVTPDAKMAISSLGEMECLVKPIQTQDAALIARFQGNFYNYTRLDLPPPVFMLAARLKAVHGIKTPDALHLACALHHGCTEFWTNDDRLMKVAAENHLRIINLTQTT
jgi:uncharacterized protein